MPDIESKIVELKVSIYYKSGAKHIDSDSSANVNQHNVQKSRTKVTQNN